MEGAYHLFHKDVQVNRGKRTMTDQDLCVERLEGASRQCYFHNLHTYFEHMSTDAQITHSEIEKTKFAIANYDLRMLYSARPPGQQRPPALHPAPGEPGRPGELYHNFLVRITGHRQGAPFPNFSARRKARNGTSYTYLEFIQFYDAGRGTAEWMEKPAGSFNEYGSEGPTEAPRNTPPDVAADVPGNPNSNATGSTEQPAVEPAASPGVQQLEWDPLNLQHLGG